MRVDGRRLSVPGYAVSPGERVEVAPQSRAHPLVMEGAERGPEVRLSSYLERTPEGFGDCCIAEPARADVPFDVRERLVVEFYAR